MGNSLSNRSKSRSSSQKEKKLYLSTRVLCFFVLISTGPSTTKARDYSSQHADYNFPSSLHSIRQCCIQEQEFAPVTFSKNSFLCAMTLSISDQPSQWHRVTARHSLLSDATIDPFPYRTSRTASLLDHHIVRDQRQDAGIIDNGRRGTVPYLPPVATPIAPPPPPPPPPQHLPAPPDPRIPPPLILPDQFHDPESRKRSIQMASQDHHSEESSSPTSIGHIDGSSSFCLCQPEPKIPRPRNGEAYVYTIRVFRTNKEIQPSFFIVNINKQRWYVRILAYRIRPYRRLLVNNGLACQKMPKVNGKRLRK